MGVNMNNYVIVGLDIKNFLDYVNEKYDEDEKYKIMDEYNDYDNNYKIIEDAMSENYCYFGYVVSESEPEEGVEMITLGTEELNTLKYKCLVELKKLYENYGFNSIIGSMYSDIKLYVFTHYS